MKNYLMRLTVLCVWLLAIRAAATTYYVDINSTNPAPPYANWSTASTDIQSAINEATNGDLVLVNPGVYQSGGETVIGVNNNRVAITKPLTVMSVSGPTVTTIAGAPSWLPGAPQTRCVYMTNGAVLIGFTLTSGQAGGGGNNGTYYDNIGGAVLSWPAVSIGNSNIIYDCILTNNYASYYGGGGYGVEFVNCLLAGNSCGDYASAASDSECINCTIVGNSSPFLGAVNNCTLINCIDYFNSAGNCGSYVSCINCCTMPDPGGINDITNAPDFENLTNDDYHLQAGSPCINTGTNTYITTASDLDGNPRIFGGTVDIGAYEYQLSTIAITQQPATQTNILGQTAVFTVTAVSPYPLSYQWLFDSNSISGATNSSLVISNVAVTDGGTYSVIVSNSFVASNSSNAVLAVFYPPPEFTQQPTNVAVILGSNALMSVTATSYLDMTFQWQLNGTNLTDEGAFSGSTSSNLLISGAGLADAGNYDVIVSDGEWSVTSAVVAVSMLFPTTMTLQPTNQTVIVPHNVSFSAAASGTGPLGFQWYFDGTPLSDGKNISGSGSSTLNISGVQLTNAGVYQVLVTNSFSEAASTAATLTVLAPVQILTEPTNEAVSIGNTADLSVIVTGTSPAYQWYFNGEPLSDGSHISGSSTATLTITNVQNADGGNYQVVVSNMVNTVSSTVATLTPQTNPGPSIRYVNVSNSAPASPYLTWSTAATNIQNAVDASISGDTIVVTNGIYSIGGETANGSSLTNRVVLNKNIIVESVNGPQSTVIEGNQVPTPTIYGGTPLQPYSVPPDGPGAVRCVCITTNAALIGFTLTDGATVEYDTNGTNGENGGGVWCAFTNGILISNCVITANAAYSEGGGAFQGTLENCLVLGNSAMAGGGVANATILQSLVVSNTASGPNESSDGGGTINCAVFSSAIAENSADNYGGGAYGGFLVNCTVTGNSAFWDGGGIALCAATNSIIYYNNILSASGGDTNYISGYPVYPLNYCCTTPNAGGANITAPPILANISHISLNSPCRGAGNPSVTSGVDIDGNPWANPPSIGCSEIPSAGDYGNLIVNISTAFTNWASGYPLNFHATISGPCYTTVWNFGDGTIVTNAPYLSHIWSSAGNYPVTLTAYNDSYPNGITETQMINITVPSIYYVNWANPNPVPPYSCWSSAAANIQDAVSVATPGSLVLVTNPTVIVSKGPDLPLVTNSVAIYQTGGTNAPDGNFYRVVITNAITVESVNGPDKTFICGSTPTGFADCVYLTDGATLSGFTVTNSYNAGQISAVSTNGVFTNCVLLNVPTVNLGTLDNCAFGASESDNSTLNNCSLHASGCENSTLNNCSLVASSGSINSTLNTCIISNNCSVLGGLLNNCILANNTNSGIDGGAATAQVGFPLVLNNCLISNNFAAANGGGICNSYGNATCILNSCTLIYNSCRYAGGATYGADLNNCLIISNTSAYDVGGVQSGVLNKCTLIGNSSYGAGYATLTNCTLIANATGGAEGCTLNRCTLSQNLGVGAISSTLTDCLIISNSPPSQGSITEGGGANYGTLSNCILAYNVATNGGAAYRATLVNCTVIANTAVTGGGIFDCTAQNCILYYNNGGDYYPATTSYPLNNCCTPVLATNGIRNITNAPLFVNLAGGDFHLQSSSPCINSGNNAYVNSATDLDGNQRIVGGTVDIGAYEYQTPTSVISYAYLQQYGLPTDGSVDFANLDGTGFNVYEDWIAGLNPTNPASVLAMQTPVATNNASGIKVTWQSVSGIPYFLQRSTNLTSQPPFSTVQNNISGQAGMTSYTDTSATNNVPYFYRVGVIAP